MHSADFPSLTSPVSPSLEATRNSGIIIFGHGTFARDLAIAAQTVGIPVLGHVVSGQPPTTHNSLPIWNINAIPVDLRSKPVWIGVFNQSAQSDYEELSQLCSRAGLLTVFPQEFFDLVANPMGWRYWLTPRSDYQAHAVELRAAYDQLVDEASRRTFAQTLAFRLGQTRRAPLPDPAVEHYFPDFAVQACRNRAQGAEVFVDGGAYDGDTLEAALQQLPFKTVYAFEPDPGNYSALASRTRRLGLQALNFPCGLSGRHEQLRFSAGQGEACAVKEDGDSMIQVVRLDDCLQNTRIDYLKLDVEGQEIPTLEAGRDLILKSRPILAIAAYHRWDDLWRIPAFVASLSIDYRLAYRSHSINSFEGVFYAY